MPQIEGFRVQNYRVLHDVTMGKLWNEKTGPLTSLVAVIGKNGTGKSTLFDAFGFLRDALVTDVEQACDARQRGGFARLRSLGKSGPIRFEIYYREGTKDRPITYELSIDADSRGRPRVVEERLRQRRKGQTTGRPYSFLWLKEASGRAWKGAEALGAPDTLEETREKADIEDIQLTDSRRLGIATLGVLVQHPRIARFRNFLESWYLSYFTPDAVRGLPLAGPQKHLNTHGDNLGNVVEFMLRDHEDTFHRILRSIAAKIPGVKKIDTKRTDDGRLLLRFNDSAFRDPFFAQQVSDGTLKMFAYLLLLEDPEPAPFLCIEEPENGLYHQLLTTLVAEFRRHSKRSQVFITTHQPYLVDSLKPEEVWVIEKHEDGFAKVRRASDNATVRNLVAEDLPLGSLWYSQYLES